VDIEGSVALVTGGASGLGEATARHLHAEGACVVLFDRDAGRADAIAAELGDRATSVPGDVLSEQDTSAALAAAAAFGPLRILVVCAGGASRSERTLRRDGTPHGLDLFREITDLNLVGTFNSLRLGAAAMAAHEPPAGDPDGERGVIVTTASIAAYEGQIGQVAYASAKAGIVGMTLVAARDLAAAGIRVNCIAPGTIGTRAWEQAPDDLRTALEAKVPFPRRFGRPAEFAALVGHLVTNRYLNGHVARLDGAIRFDPK
jgi:NAD(P)-dependent dehydrogenase (short-subunit alcohol dehydrogenase family)